jgi:hypothetical protein
MLPALGMPEAGMQPKRGRELVEHDAPAAQIAITEIPKLERRRCVEALLGAATTGFFPNVLIEAGALSQPLCEVFVRDKRGDRDTVRGHAIRLQPGQDGVLWTTREAIRPQPAVAPVDPERARRGAIIVIRATEIDELARSVERAAHAHGDLSKAFPTP